MLVFQMYGYISEAVVLISCSKIGMMILQNKIALVTGASKGIGRATALTLAEAGAHVLVHYGRSVREAESLVSAIQSKGGRADAVTADLASRDGAFLLAKQVRSWEFDSEGGFGEGRWSRDGRRRSMAA